MRIAIAAIGRMKAGPERDMIARYLKRAIGTGKPLGLTGFDVRESPESRADTVALRKAEEAKALSAQLGDGPVVILDERGSSIDSEALASRVAGWRDDGASDLSFVIGGADGLDQDFVASAALSLSFSRLTWPHQLVRIMLAEQLYRTTTILAGHPYHRS
ncbi:ribosomal RNA large subunit methyltransferase H [Devosia pacifica]|uniref:Ribosomal RNA large subunit methyltransferase H n=1 Tax=Devosia pacifica TaxID=1335967 RepID=A0A918VUB7_9HYPH|nr:23S rRNA (pseudouridine(1915)-N(3))-methyltransferase RlmH [Devosia pacifica]GHA24805.1 ribosomal RNA large subunit methyltransferase H [Devosia pacifica]